jgi:hypothetical protein
LPYLVAGKWIDSFVIVVVAPAELRIRFEVLRLRLNQLLLGSSWPGIVGGLARRWKGGDQLGVLGGAFHNKCKEFRAAENKEQQDRQMNDWEIVQCGHHSRRMRKAYTLIAHHSGGSGRFCIKMGGLDVRDRDGSSHQKPTAWDESTNRRNVEK